MTLKYIGNGEFLRGIPKRDLSDAEAEKHGGAEFLIGTGLYTLDAKLDIDFENDAVATAAKHRYIDAREQQAPAAPIEQPKRKTKWADSNKSVKDG